MSELSFDQKIANVIFNFEGVAKSGYNPHFKAKFRNIESIHPKLVPACYKEGIYYNFECSRENVLRLNVVEASTGEVRHSSRQLVEMKNDQDFGKQMTYTMRYLVSAFFNIAQPDDDGEQNMRRKETKEENRVPNLSVKRW